MTDPMSTVYGDPVEVWAVDGIPVRFVYRDQLYTVRRILEHGLAAVETGNAQTQPTGKTWWQVEATPGTRYGVYELRHDAVTNQWLLAVIEREAE